MDFQLKKIFQLKVSSKISEKKVKKLVKQKKNKEIQNILRNIVPIQRIHETATAMLHMAAKYDNLALVKYLVNIVKVNVDYPDALGTTPLITAVLNSNYRVVEFLLASNALICIGSDNNRSALQLALMTNAPKYVIKYFVDSLTRNDDSEPHRIAQILRKNNFPLKYLLLIDDPEVTRLILEQRNYIDHTESVYLVRRAMKLTSRHNMQTLKVLLKHGPSYQARQRIFVREFSYILESAFPSRKYVTSLIRQLVSLDGVDDNFIRYVEAVFYMYKKEPVQLLLESKIDEHVKEKTGQDMRVYLFGNPKVNAIEMIKHSGREFDVNSNGRRGLNALHYAAKNKLHKNVRYLLDNGVNADVRDDLGITPLFYAADVECLQLLLERGADVQATKSDGLAILDSDRCPVALLVLVSQVAILDAQGLPINEKTRESIDSYPSFKAFYDKCCQQIDWMKSRKIFKYGTLFDVVSKKSEDLVPYVRDVKSQSKVMDFNFYKSNLHWYYYFTVKRRLTRAMKICKLKRKVGTVISQSIGIFGNNHIVIDKIVGHLSFEDLLAFE